MRSPLLEQFLTEGRDLIEEASGSLLVLERAPQDTEVINRIFRSVHTLKGNSGLFEYPALTGLLHVAEELMVAVRDASISLTPEMVDALLGAADAVRTFLDEIDAAEALTPASTEEGKRIAETMESFLSGNGGTGDEPSAPEPAPDWADQIKYRPRGPAVAFRYGPDASCFFRGEDPLGLVGQLPSVVWRQVVFGDETGDPFECHLSLFGVTTSPAEEVRHLFRYVEDEVELWEMPDEAPGTEETGLSLADDETTSLVSAVLLKQLEVLDAAEVEVLPSVKAVLERCFRRVEDKPRASGVGLLEDANAARALIQDFLEARRASAEARAAASMAGESADPSRSGEDSGSSGPTDAPSEASAAGSGPAKVLRVEQTKVDRLMNLIGQLVVAKNGLPYLARRLETHGDAKVASRELKEHGAVVDRIARELQNAIMEVRMLPVSQVFQRFPRLVRDVSRKLDKKIELTLIGEETHADKNVIEALSEPLVHLVRNSLDHGIEPPAERRAKGKSATGNIRLTARNENESVVITIEDDGRGIDPDILREKAVRKGLHTAEEVAALSDEEARMLIFAAGFSTKEQATDLSGRGVGMDVVRTHIEKAGGRISLESEVGTGTTTTLWLPLSMAVSHVMTVTVQSQLYGIGMDFVVETVRCPAKSLRIIKGREAFVLRDELVPVLRLRDLLGLEPDRVLNSYEEEAVLVLRVRGESLGLVVDEFGENIEVLVRPLEGWIGNMKEYSGSAVLGDGRLLLVLDLKELVDAV